VQPYLELGLVRISRSQDYPNTVSEVFAMAFGRFGNSMFSDIKGHSLEISHFFTDSKVVGERYF